MDEMTVGLKNLFASNDPDQRIDAVRQLAGMQELSMEYFALGLGDEDWRVRKSAIEAFRSLNHQENFVNELIELLHHQENAGLRNAAIEILIELGPMAVHSLRREMKSLDAGVRKFVIDILGEIGDLRCAEDLVSSLSDQDVNVRYAAVETLGKLQVSSASEALLVLMEDPDLGLKFTILQALANIGGQLKAERLFPYMENRLLHKALFDCFGKIGGREVVPFLVDGLNDPMRTVREAALLALCELLRRESIDISNVLIQDQNQLAEYLELILAGDNQILKSAALDVYAAVGSDRNLIPLLRCVADEQLRAQVLMTFSILGESAYNRLVNTPGALASPELIYLVYVGGELGFARVLSLASENIHAGDPQLRFAAARALGETGSLDHVDPLLLLLDDEISEIQDSAGAAIARLGQHYRAEILKIIEPYLADPDADKRMRIVRILSQIDGQEIESLLLRAFKDFSGNVRCEAVRALHGHFGDDVVSGLTLALTDESSEVRRLAVSALGQCPQDKALKALSLAAGDADLWVRSAVMRAMAHFNGEDVRSVLSAGVADTVGLVVIAALESASIVLPDESQQLLVHALAHQDEEVVKAAMTLLGRISGKNWIAPFCKALLNHSHWDVRVHAANTLGQSSLNDAVTQLENRLLVEGEDIVRQAIEAAITSRLRSEAQVL